MSVVAAKHEPTNTDGDKNAIPNANNAAIRVMWNADRIEYRMAEQIQSLGQIVSR